MKTLLRIEIYHEYSISLGYIEKEINENYLDTFYDIENFFGKNISFKVQKIGFNEKENIIIATGILQGVCGYTAQRDYFRESGLNLAILEINPDDFKKNIYKIEKLGFKFIINELYFQTYLETFKIKEKMKLHNTKRTLFQKIFGLNKFKK